MSGGIGNASSGEIRALCSFTDFLSTGNKGAWDGSVYMETSREHLAAAVAPFDQDVTREREQRWWPPPPLPSTGQQCSHPYHRPLFAFIVLYTGTMTYRLTSEVALHRPPPPNCIGE